jgi:hypothetical protein
VLWRGVEGSPSVLMIATSAPDARILADEDLAPGGAQVVSAMLGCDREVADRPLRREPSHTSPWVGHDVHQHPASRSPELRAAYQKLYVIDGVLTMYMASPPGSRRV